MSPIKYVRAIIDREWIRVDWCGSQTLIHRVVSLVPLIAGGLLGSLFSSRGVGVAMASVGLAVTIATGVWIEGRRLVGTGSFSNRRSEQFVRRMRLKTRKKPDEGSGEA